MRIKDIEIIVRILECGSFSRAADMLRISQPAVSLAVKRAEDELGVRIFDRSGSSVTVASGGHGVVKGFQKILEIYEGLVGSGAESRKIRIGISPLLSGRDVTRILTRVLQEAGATIDVEFLDSRDISTRSDFDVRIVAPTLKRRSSHHIDFPTAWIGVDNGTFIYSKQESEVWDRARAILIEAGKNVANVIEVNDCGYAYHMATSGAGFTPCVLTSDIAFRDNTLTTMPDLPPMRLDIFSPPDIAVRLKNSLLGL
ncbi:LysR family transcriptional regulator [Chthonobacter albigriseus]|uniref:LysR family transcriptional regulator n=1 Tax=Chthonobacter albigriseus TaxID=1683161 RepID=UPI0015EF7EC5|nr:LysR family transcriptional regulator [Chthonobacter albigriseus]